VRNDSGTYLLWLRVDTEQSLEVGALGEVEVQPGWYAYAGSAFGPGGVRARVERHVRGDGATHWHVDYLRAAAALTAVWFTHDDARRECDWAQVLRDLADEPPGTSVPISGFGATDCDCPAHLVHFDDPPSLATFRRRLHATFPNHAAVDQVEDLGGKG
jgi:Uri superfamily endonuclease